MTPRGLLADTPVQSCSTHRVRPVRASLALVVLVTFALGACTRVANVATTPPACAAHTFPLAGACVPEEDARAYCGNVAAPEAGGCVQNACAAGDPLDLGSGECVPRMKLHKLASARNVDRVDDGLLGCAKDDAALSVEGSNVVCIPRKVQCGRGARWSIDHCRPDAACPAGSVPDSAGACVGVVRRENGESVLDVGTWIRSVVGPDGGEGTSAICGPVMERPWLAGVVAHGNAVLEVQVDIVFPDNDVAHARVTAKARRRFDPHSAEPASLMTVTESLEPVWKALRSVGGVASAASASAGVHCALEGGTDAIAIPHEKDASASADSGKPAS